MQEPGTAQRSGQDRGFRGVITDWGGVMTNPIPATVRAWLDAEDIDVDSYAAVIRPWIVAAYDPAGATFDAANGTNPIHELERGECTTEEFEHLLASLLVCRDGSPVSAEGLLTRMFAASVPCDPMYGAMYTARGAGLRTGLLSNSWGVSDYPRHLFGDLFDAVVISAEVGMRKPEERIFLHAAGLLGLPPGECVFIDDVEANITAAEAVGMTAILHTEPEATITRLHDLLGLPGGPAGG
ncbi:MAG: HAD family hydrolase [Gemmatimonadota bacterium]